MKYMGSKRAMLTNGLGQMIRGEATRASRFVDLFCGSAAVSWYTAENTPLPVLAVDLQEFGVVLARSVVARAAPLLHERPSRWLDDTARSLQSMPRWRLAQGLRNAGLPAIELVRLARSMCADEDGGVVWRAYGGHYFSPWQALIFDCLLERLPEQRAHRDAALAAIIHTASKCAAAPGHTAQPFQPTPTAINFIIEAWNRDPVEYCQRALEEICMRFAQQEGDSYVGDAQHVAAGLCSTDLVFVDPPYSNVQYSRFYHVLETIARGEISSASGSGRYPPPSERPISSFSLRSESRQAIQVLLETLSERGCTVILTFPLGEASNGLSGCEIENMAQRLFSVTQHHVSSRFSTLGGGENGNRKARQRKIETILLLRNHA